MRGEALINLSCDYEPEAEFFGRDGERAEFFHHNALTPDPSLTPWERGAGNAPLPNSGEEGWFELFLKKNEKKQFRLEFRIEGGYKAIVRI